MKKPEESIRQRLWEQVAPEMDVIIDAALSNRLKGEKRKTFLKDALKLAYTSGLDRGYDLGFVVFGDGPDDDDSDDGDDDGDDES